jgi:fumarate reductase iron-sulfur subunit
LRLLQAPTFVEHVVFGCICLLACHDVCPQNLPLDRQIAPVRRQMVRHGFAKG